jgi:hypothetical protein
VVVCSSPKAWFETYLPLISPVVGWLLIIAGWAVVHRTGKHRARRQEELAIVDALERRLDELRARAIVYYTSVPAEGLPKPTDSERRTEERALTAAKRQEEEFYIKQGLAAVRGIINLLHVRKAKKHYAMTKDFKALRRAFLGEGIGAGTGFESAQRVLVDHASPTVVGISIQVQAIVMKLRTEFENANPDRFLG